MNARLGYLIGSALAFFLVTPVKAQSRIDRLTFTSTILAEADQVADNDVAIYLPDGYDTSPFDYPVVYLLHGNTGDPGHFLGQPGFATRSADELTAGGRFRPLILVIPQLNKRGLNAPSVVHERYLTRELIPFVDATYRTIPTRNARAIAGWSRGGSDALYTAMAHPRAFSIVGIYASAGFYRVSPFEELFTGRGHLPLPLRFWIYLGTNDGDANNAQFMRPFVELLDRLHFPHVYTEDEGTHFSIAPHVKESLRYFSERLWATAHVKEHNLRSITRTIVAVAGGVAAAADFEVVLEDLATEPAPSLSVDLSVVGGGDELPMTHTGNGRYSARVEITPPQREGVYILPVRSVVEGADPRLVYGIEMLAVPAEDRVLLGDSLGSDWTGPSFFVGSADPQATNVAFEGQTSLRLQSDLTTAGTYLSWEPAEPVDYFGYSLLHFALHPGELEEAGDPPSFNVRLTDRGGQAETHALLGADSGEPGVDLQEIAWQVVELPLKGGLQSIAFTGNIKGSIFLDDIRLIRKTPTGTPILEEFPPLIRLIGARDQFSGIEGELALPLDLEVELQTTREIPGLSLSVDLSAVGEESVRLVDQGKGRYSARSQITKALGQGVYGLPVVLEADNRDSEIFAFLRALIFPSAERILWADGLTPEWKQENKLMMKSFDPESTARVFEGNNSVSVQPSVTNSIRYLTWEPDEPVKAFGYRLHFAFHPGEVDAAGEPPEFKVRVEKTDSMLPQQTVELLHGAEDGHGVDLQLDAWQVVDVPLGTGLMTSIGFAGNLEGTFYLDDIRLVPETPVATAVVEESLDNQPERYGLEQNFPNPFNSGTEIHFDLPQSGIVELTVYNLSGQKVVTLIEGGRTAGTHTVRWDGRSEAGRSLASGVYLYRLTSGSFTHTRRMVMLK